MRKARAYIALLHYPVYNKRMDIVATSITNLDLHDIARAARTYDVEGFYVIHPAASQQKLIQDILAYWQEGYGGRYNQDRKEAFQGLRLVPDLAAAIARLEAEAGQPVITVATDAKEYPLSIPYAALRSRIWAEEAVFLLLFGTGWGLTQEIISGCDLILAPVGGASDYNHLAVRSAVSIILDRLLGDSWFDQ